MKTSTILRVLEGYPWAHFELHYEGYVEPGYNDPESGLIATGDWNPRSWDRPIPKEDLLMPRIGAILEKLKVELQWEDEWCTCGECGKLVRTQPDSYSWTRSYWYNEGIGLYCEDCILEDPEDYLEYLEGNPDTANTLNLDLEDQGYRRVDEDFENGLSGGQCDDPHKIAESLRELGIERFIFEIDSTEQFGLAFSVWVHKSEYDKLDLGKIESKGPDPALAAQSALRTATVKLVSEQDFIDGKTLD